MSQLEFAKLVKDSKVGQRDAKVVSKCAKTEDERRRQQKKSPKERLSGGSKATKYPHEMLNIGQTITAKSRAHEDTQGHEATPKLRALKVEPDQGYQSFERYPPV